MSNEKESVYLDNNLQRERIKEAINIITPENEALLLEKFPKWLAELKTTLENIISPDFRNIGENRYKQLLVEKLNLGLSLEQLNPRTGDSLIRISGLSFANLLRGTQTRICLTKIEKKVSGYYLYSDYPVLGVRVRDGKVDFIDLEERSLNHRKIAIGYRDFVPIKVLK
ncbi:MAG: hypothetical protein AAB437_04005 [Patescibacteria group bacterium]